MNDNIKKFNVILIAIAILLFCIRVYLLDNSLKALLTRYMNIKYFLPVSNNYENKKQINIILYVIYFIIIFVVLLNMVIIKLTKNS